MASIFQEEIEIVELSSNDFEEVTDFELQNTVLHVKEASGTTCAEYTDEETRCDDESNCDDVDISGVVIMQPDDNQDLPPVTKLKRLAESIAISNRQLAAKKILETLIEVDSDELEVHSVIYIAYNLSEDADESVRAALAMHIPAVAGHYKYHGSTMESIIKQQLLPILVKLGEERHAQVCSHAHASILALLETGLVDDALFNDWICPMVMQQTLQQSSLMAEAAADDDRRFGAITLMCKMAVLIGREKAVNAFLEHFALLTSDAVFSVRKACAMNFGEFCKVVGPENTETVLLPKFFNLCADTQWDIRKACIDVFVDIASIMSPDLRRGSLLRVFMTLLGDEARWVRYAAYQMLGRFIALFADPEKTGLLYNPDGTWTYLNPDEERARRASRDSVTSACSFESDVSGSTRRISVTSEKQVQKEQRDISPKNHPLLSETNDTASNTDSDCNSASEFSNYMFELISDASRSRWKKLMPRRTLRSRFSSKSSDNSLTVTTKSGHVHLRLDNDSEFNNFQYWRMPLPEIEVDVDIIDGQATNIHVRTKILDSETNQLCKSDMSLQISPQDSLVPNDGHAGDGDNNSINSSKFDDDSPNTYRLDEDSPKMLVQTACVNTISPSLPESPYSKFSNFRSRGMSGCTSFSRPSLPSLDTSYTTFNSPMSSNSLAGDFISPYDQDIVPPELIEKFLAMVKPVLSQSMDPEITKHCAAALPCVSYTLGRRYWACIRQVCVLLVYDMQWKVRRTMALCLHEIAVILGCELTSRDLFPLFLILLTDVDEVRAGLLDNLAQFLEHVYPSERQKFLPQMESFLKMDNERNWRFRDKLARQLIPVTELYSPNDVYEYLVPVALYLIKDKVCEVRQSAVRLFAVILLRLTQCTDVLHSILEELHNELKLSKKWLWRQLYLILCERIIIKRSLPTDIFAEVVAPSILDLCSDVVPNIRLAAARCLTTLLFSDYCHCTQTSHGPLLEQAVSSLHADTDRDVCFISYLLPDLSVSDGMLSLV